MDILRPIEDKYSIEKEHWVGTAFRVKNYFPEGKNLLDRFSPFALMDYNAPREFPPSKSARGIGPHPHRGIETVTLAFQGSVEHHDNAGHHGIIYPGDVQWMTAGKGIMHKEYHEKGFQKTGGIFHVVQLWISLPKKDKFTEPRYQDIRNENMGKIRLENGMGEITVISGEVIDTKGPALTFSPINLYVVNLQSQGKITLEEPGNYNTGILIMKGNIEVNNTSCVENDFVLFENREGKIKINNASKDTKILVLSGEPLNEPALAAGPFVMNTKEELRQAAEDYRNGVFGTDNF
ncbi:pirin family protein [Tissierella creatinini]|nr:pirin family protein [Tissierella creatinini]TJX66738.1 pirin family protein [Soehngenia saccharolytica]